MSHRQSTVESAPAPVVTPSSICAGGENSPSRKLSAPTRALDSQERLRLARDHERRLRALALAAGRLPPLMSFTPTPRAL